MYEPICWKRVLQFVNPYLLAYHAHILLTLLEMRLLVFRLRRTTILTPNLIWFAEYFASSNKFPILRVCLPCYSSENSTTSASKSSDAKAPTVRMRHLPPLTVRSCPSFPAKSGVSYIVRCRCRISSVWLCCVEKSGKALSASFFEVCGLFTV